MQAQHETAIQLHTANLIEIRPRESGSQHQASRECVVQVGSSKPAKQIAIDRCPKFVSMTCQVSTFSILARLYTGGCGAVCRVDVTFKCSVSNHAFISEQNHSNTASAFEHPLVIANQGYSAHATSYSPPRYPAFHYVTVR